MKNTSRRFYVCVDNIIDTIDKVGIFKPATSTVTPVIESKKEKTSFWKHPFVVGVVYPALGVFIIWVSTLLYAKLSTKSEPPSTQQSPTKK